MLPCQQREQGAPLPSDVDRAHARLVVARAHDFGKLGVEPGQVVGGELDLDRACVLLEVRPFAPIALAVKRRSGRQYNGILLSFSPTRMAGGHNG